MRKEMRKKMRKEMKKRDEKRQNRSRGNTGTTRDDKRKRDREDDHKAIDKGTDKRDVEKKTTNYKKTNSDIREHSTTKSDSKKDKDLRINKEKSAIKESKKTEGISSQDSKILSQPKSQVDGPRSSGDETEPFAEKTSSGNHHRLMKEGTQLKHLADKTEHPNEAADLHIRAGLKWLEAGHILEEEKKRCLQLIQGNCRFFSWNSEEVPGSFQTSCSSLLQMLCGVNG